MKRTRLLTALIAMVLTICMTATMGSLTTAAQEVSDEISDMGGSAFSDIKTTYIVTLYWDDNDNAYGTRPDEVSVILTANSGEFGSDYLFLNEANHWENVKSGLPVFYYKGSRTGTISYEYEILDLPEEYSISIVQEGNWFKVTCSLNKAASLIGDVDLDGEVSITDATLVQRYDAAMIATGFDYEAGDVNGDQSVDILDTSIIQRYLGGLDCSKFDVGKEI